MKKKKKILFLTSKMIVGGVERVLINLLKYLDLDRYDITLLLTIRNGTLESEIPSGVTVKYLEHNIPKYDKQLLQNAKYCQWIRNKILRGLAHLFSDHWINTYLNVSTWSAYEEPYDIIVAYKADDAVSTCVVDKFNAHKKILWVHSILPNTKRFLLCYKRIINRFNGIICVSYPIKQHTATLFSTYSGKICVIHNLFDADRIQEESSKDFDYCFANSINPIVTVGRLSSEKGQQMVPFVTRMLLDAGYDIRWYLVGDGPLREEIEQEIRKYDVSDRVILLGTKTNPYPYIKNCRIYVQPSFSEGYCTTTMEAKVLCKPVVTTDAPGMREQFVSGENGLIVDAMTPEALFEGIRTLLDHPELCRKFEEKLRQESFDDAANAKELQKLYDFIES